MEGFFHLNHDLLNLLFNQYLVYNDYVNLLLVCKDLKRFLESKKRQIYGNGEEIVALRYWRFTGSVYTMVEYTIFIDVFKKWYFDKETTDIGSNIVWKGGTLHISGCTSRCFKSDKKIPKFVKRARNNIATWWEFNFWELRKMWYVWHLLLHKNVTYVKVHKLGEYLLSSRVITTEKLKLLFCFYFSFF